MLKQPPALLRQLLLVGVILLSADIWAAKQTSTADKPRVLLKTDLGNITLELYPEKAPKTVANFLRYVDEGFYNGVIFHRVIPGFVVQTGGLTFDFIRKPTHEPVANESANGLKNYRGTIAMARYSDPDSATSQFFINMKHNKDLNARKGKPGYSVFGKVVQGMKVASLITKEKRGLYRSHSDAPNVPVRILDAKRLTTNPDTHKK